MKLKGKKAEGKAYENKAVRHLQRELLRVRESSKELLPRCNTTRPVFYIGQWFRFEDSNGPGFAQPDLFIHTGKRIVVFECKLTRHPKAEKQLAWLYFPLLWHFYRVPLVGVELFQNPGPDYEPHEDSPANLYEALRLPDWSIAEWHLLI